jgi:hypothetical protein
MSGHRHNRSSIRAHAWLRHLLAFGGVAAVASTLTCEAPLDLCTPKTARLEFFSKGDCMLTRASFFQGHEWLSFFANRDLPAEERFSDSDVRAMVEGNRRVDWPKELLIHMNAGITAYASALTEYTDRPENQRFHFLLSDVNDSAEAASDSRQEVLRLTREAMALWTTKRVRALTLVGKAHHIIQDSFSAAHARRDQDSTTAPWCILKVKAYIRRAPGHDGPDIEYHGSDDAEGVGHTTTLDSIYRSGRDCHEPATPEAVEECLADTARRARLATRDYLKVLRAIERERGSADIDEVAEEQLLPFFEQHMQMCP